LAVGTVTCPLCQLRVGEGEEMVDHLATCGAQDGWRSGHRHLIECLGRIAKEAGLGQVAVEMGGLVDQARKRPGDVTVLGFAGDARHLVVDVVITREFCASNIVSASKEPGALLRAAEKKKMDRYTVGRRWRGKGTDLFPLRFLR